jgi:hypothetical protein
MKLTGKNRSTGGKPVPLPRYPPQIPHGANTGSIPGLRGERPATDRLSHGTALFYVSGPTLLLSVSANKHGEETV